MVAVQYNEKKHLSNGGYTPKHATNIVIFSDGILMMLEEICAYANLTPNLRFNVCVPYEQFERATENSILLVDHSQ